MYAWLSICRACSSQKTHTREKTREIHARLACVPYYDPQQFARREGLLLGERRLRSPSRQQSGCFREIFAYNSETPGDRWWFRNPRKAADRLASPPSFPSLHTCGAKRRVPPGSRVRGLRFKGLPPSDFLRFFLSCSEKNSWRESVC